jgi:hypothetical protein
MFLDTDGFVEQMINECVLQSVQKKASERPVEGDQYVRAKQAQRRASSPKTICGRSGCERCEREKTQFAAEAGYRRGLRKEERGRLRRPSAAEAGCWRGCERSERKKTICRQKRVTGGARAKKSEAALEKDHLRQKRVAGGAGGGRLREKRASKGVVGGRPPELPLRPARFMWRNSFGGVKPSARSLHVAHAPPRARSHPGAPN